MHCVNALLQGPFFDEISMSQVAMQLTEQEQILMGNKGPASYQNENVGLDGNFSI